jgi:hypothetical protein
MTGCEIDEVNTDTSLSLPLKTNSIFYKTIKYQT